MATDHHAIDDLKRAVLDGEEIEWLDESMDGETGRLVKHLRVVAAIANAHRAEAFPTGATSSETSRLAPLETWGHLRIIEGIGRGAFGEVYRARDPRLERDVALKLVPATEHGGPAFSMLREGQLLARLRHPNVVTIHGADQIDGHVGLWMELVPGRTLEELLQAGTVFHPVEVTRIGIELAEALSAVHNAGVLHRDVKAQNVMRADDGRIVLMDFGAGLDLAGTSGDLSGTPLYLAPELFRGEPATVQSDVYSLGVVLYHLLTRSYPTQGKTFSELKAAHERGLQTRVGAVNPAVPKALAQVVDRALHPAPGARYSTADALRGDLTRAMASHRWRSRRRAAFLPALAAVVACAAGVAWLWNEYRQITWASQEAMLRIEELIGQDDFLEAFLLAERAERYIPQSKVLAEKWPRISKRVSLVTSPEGAAVYVTWYRQRNASWRYVGTTPVNFRVPIDVLQVRVEKPGYDTADLMLHPEILGEPSLAIELTPATTARDMSRVPEDRQLLPALFGLKLEKNVLIHSYEIGRHEVTNAEYSKFVKGRGYERKEYWTHEFIKDGRTLEFPDAMREFRDKTGLPGPSTWSGGRYPDGKENHPVTGVSWYEAAAYAEFVGRRLPTVAHWARAAGTPLAAAIIARSNFSNQELRPVGAGDAMSPFGALDMAGNAREWVFNNTPDQLRRYALGGAWNEPSYTFLHPKTAPPFDRSAENGFRVAQYDGEDDGRLRSPVEVNSRDVSRAKPVSDQVFATYKRLFDYDKGELNARSEDAGTADGFTVKTVSISPPGGGERIKAYLYLPTKFAPPYQTLIFFPGAGAALENSSEHLRKGPGLVLDDVIRSGRAVLFPIYHGTYERRDGTTPWPEVTTRYMDYTIRQIKEVRRWVEFLSSDTRIDPTQLGYVGFSWGAGSRAALVLAVEPCLKTGILYSGGLSLERSRSEVDPINYISRVSVPVLMLNGTEDFIIPFESGQKPFLDLLKKTPQHLQHLHKRLEGGHAIMFLHRHTVVKETTEWLERHLASDLSNPRLKARDSSDSTEVD